MQRERLQMQQQFQQMQLQLVSESSGNEQLQSKMKKLYSVLHEKIDDKEGLDNVFAEIIYQEEDDGRYTSARSSPEKAA